MKKPFILLCLICLIFLMTSPLMAGGVDNRSNYSAEYIRTLNRNAATDSIDIIAYNPAGVMVMEDGLYANISLHYVGKDYTNTVNGQALEQDTPSVVPGLFALYKKDKWAGFFSLTIPAGGGKVEYESGNATTRVGATILMNQINALAGAAVYGTIGNERLEGEGIYYGFTLGGAYKFNDIISASLAVRYIDAQRKANAAFQLTPTALGVLAGMPTRIAILDYEEDADGVGLIMGLNIAKGPFNIGIRYETVTVLDFQYTVNQDTITGLPAGLGAAQGILNGARHPRNLPAVFGFGIGYSLFPNLRFDANYTIYSQSNADWGGAEVNVDNGWEAGISMEYIFNESLKASIGYLYTDTGMEAQYMLNEVPELNADSFGAGLVYKWNPNLETTFGVGMVSYDSDSYINTSSGTPLVIGFEKDVFFVALGMQYKF